MHAKLLKEMRAELEGAATEHSFSSSSVWVVVPEEGKIANALI